MRSVSIVIPVYNEQARVGGTIRSVRTYLRRKRYDFEIIVVDDGSTDSTLAVLRSVRPHVKILTSTVNEGKGAAVRKGVLAAKKQWVLFTDADLSTPIEEIEKLFACDADIAVGSRAVRGSDVRVKQPSYRHFSGKLFNKVLKVMGLTRLNDTQCGFKLFRRKAAHDTFSRLTVKGFAFDIEALFLAQRSGYTIAECPVVWRNNPDTRVRFARDAGAMFIDAVKIRFRRY
jgi:dolichyl-phosphate beta-glucosyltransferase